MAYCLRLVSCARVHVVCRVCRGTDTFIQKTKKLYLDTKSERNLDRVAKELTEVHQVMTRNIQEILSRGQKIDSTLLYTRAIVILYCRDDSSLVLQPLTCALTLLLLQP